MTAAASRPASARGGEVRGPRSTPTLIGVGVFFLFFFALFVALGTWQVQRRAWKLDLIARVEQRVHAPPTPAPGPGEWPQVDAQRDEYRRVRAAGRYLYGHDTRVQAVTRFGPGYWLLTPLRTDAGWTVLVNRGFVPQDWRPDAETPPGAEATAVDGLLRISEPKGAFLRRNQPQDGRWFSRDVAAIADAQGLGAVAPYFIDAADTAPADGQDHWPRGGLTVTTFRNSHLSYLLTWYGLALLVAFGAWRVAVEECRARRVHRTAHAAIGDGDRTDGDEREDRHHG